MTRTLVLIYRNNFGDKLNEDIFLIFNNRFFDQLSLSENIEEDYHLSKRFSICINIILSS